MELEKDILELAALIERLRAEDSDLRVFGANGHEYQMGPKLSDAEIGAFEQKHGIVLPADYRLWLQLVGNGSGRKGRWPIAGLGPDYGIYNLEDTAFATLPSKPFQPSLHPNPDIKGDDPIFAVASNDSDDEEIFGVLEMGTPGCAYNTYLVVNGESYGTIWSSCEDEFWPTELTFAQWVRQWAESVLPRVIHERTTDALRVGMTKAQVLAICGEARDNSIQSNLPLRYLSFKNFVTAVELDENDVVTRIVKHSIVYSPKKPSHPASIPTHSK